MEVLIVGVLCGSAFVVSALLWHVHVRPDLVLDLLHDPSRPSPPPDPRAVALLRWALSFAVLSLGFLTGAALSFLTATQGR